MNNEKLIIPLQGVHFLGLLRLDSALEDGCGSTHAARSYRRLAYLFSPFPAS